MMLSVSSTRTPLPPGFAAIWTCVALDLVGFGIVLPILPLYAERYGARPATAGALVASFSLAQLVCAPLWGRVSDRFGRKPVLIVSLVGTAVGSLVTGLAPALWVLFLGRVLDGVSGASVSVAQAAVTDVAAPDERARLLGLLGAAFGLGFVAGPALGGLAALGGPRTPFLLAAALAAANAVVATRRLPETRPPSASVRISAPHGVPDPDRRGVGGLVVVSFIGLVAFSAFEATFALFGERRIGLRLASTGAVFAGIGVLIAVVQSTMIRPANARFGERRTLQLGLALNAAGLLVLAAAHHWPPLVLALLLLTVGQGLVMPTVTAAVAGRAHEDRRATALGIQQSAGGLARVIGPVSGGLVFQHVGVPAPYVAGAALMAIAATLVP
jgi:multidrug resistance protein